MEYVIGHCTGKDIAATDRYYTPKELAPPTNKFVWCYSRYGCVRKDIFNPNFDTHWASILPKPKKEK